MYVTDTHSFLWHLQKDEKLSSKARIIFEACDNQREVIAIPSIVLIESMFICEKKKIGIGFGQILENLKYASNYYIYPLDEEVVLECSKISLREPHDRIIMATANILKTSLITKDKNITKSCYVKTIW